MKTVLAPVDFSIVTNRVADAAIKLARLLQGRVMFLHVVPPPLGIRNVLPAVEDVEMRTKSAGHDADKKLDELKHAFQRKFGGIEVLRLSGPPVATILEQAQKIAAEYIVIGSHGHSAAYDVLMGSVATGVVKKSVCPVLIVPPVATQAEPGKVAAREPATA
jgi:nucleotide-binding universal stress UspA family protein